jgi:hypothetical protein
MSFLDNYEDVNARIKRFRTEYPTGRLVAFIEDKDLAAGWILIRAEAYREYEDEKPSAIDYAFGNVASLTQNMKKWLVEDCTTSSYGRVIGLLSPSDTHQGRPTRQDMERVESLPAASDPWATLTVTQVAHDTGTTALTTAVAEIGNQLGGELVSEKPRCVHGTMIWAEGTSAKTGKPWAAYKCTEKQRANQCDPYWHVLNSQGKWVPQV